MSEASVQEQTITESPDQDGVRVVTLGGISSQEIERLQTAERDIIVSNLRELLSSKENMRAFVLLYAQVAMDLLVPFNQMHVGGSRNTRRVHTILDYFLCQSEYDVNPVSFIDLDGADVPWILEKLKHLYGVTRGIASALRFPDIAKEFLGGVAEAIDDNIEAVVKISMVKFLVSDDSRSIVNTGVKNWLSSISVGAESSDSYQSYYTKIYRSLSEASAFSKPPLTISAVDSDAAKTALLDAKVTRVGSKAAVILLREVCKWRLLSRKEVVDEEDSLKISFATSFLSALCSVSRRRYSNSDTVPDVLISLVSLIERGIELYPDGDAREALRNINAKAKEVLFNNTYRGIFLTSLPVEPDSEEYADVVGSGEGISEFRHAHLMAVRGSTFSTKHLLSRFNKKMQANNPCLVYPGDTSKASTVCRGASTIPHRLMDQGSFNIFRVISSIRVPKSCDMRVGSKEESQRIAKEYVTSLLGRYFKGVNKELEEKGLSLAWFLDGVSNLSNRDVQIERTAMFRRYLGLRSQQKAQLEEVKAIYNSASSLRTMPYFYFKPSGTLQREAKRKIVFSVTLSLCAKEDSLYANNVFEDTLSPEEREEWVRSNMDSVAETGRLFSIGMLGDGEVERFPRAVLESILAQRSRLSLRETLVRSTRDITPSIIDVQSTSTTNPNLNLPSRLVVSAKQTENVLSVIPMLTNIYNTFHRRTLRGITKLEL